MLRSIGITNIYQNRKNGLDIVYLQSACKSCPEGYYCDGTIQNNTFCSTGVQNPAPCEPGNYCPNATKFSNEYRCPNGTYSDQYYLKDSSECESVDMREYFLVSSIKLLKVKVN